MLNDYIAFVNDGFESQQKYAAKIGAVGPIDLYNVENAGGKGLGTLSEDQLKYRYAKIIEHFGHLIEEAIEARVYVPRRSWKNNEPSYLDDSQLRQEFIAEMFDILLFHRAILAYAGITGEEFYEVAMEKYAYNQTRKDHNVNGDEKASKDPAAELHGDCASASFTGTPNNTYDRD